MKAEATILGLVLLVINGCASQPETTSTPQPYASDRYDSRDDRSLERTLLIQARLASVSPSTVSVQGNATAPPVGQTTTVQGQMEMRTISSMETLAQVGRDFQSRSNAGAADISMRGHLTRVGRSDGRDGDLYHINLSFTQNDSSGTTTHDTGVDIRLGESRMITGLSGGRTLVLSLLRPDQRSDIPPR